MQNYRDTLLKTFGEEYQKLNESQRKAVDTIEGPVMVIAGPGTGKTQILACRIGKILLETDALPSNILCLTYTEAGVLAMRRRLLQFIGPDAYRVNIFTFHAFCNEIIQENLSHFEKNVLEPISDLETIEILSKIIDALPKNNPLKRYRGNAYYEIQNLKTLFENMKREGWTPEYLSSEIDVYISSLPQREEYIYKKATGAAKKGDLKQQKLDEEKEKMEKLQAAVNEFNHYQELMRARERYDFADMINWVIKVFEDNPSILANYQEKYQYILVDEYQDTSGSQNKLVQLLINFWDLPNIFVVGDDDQSIFRFQGANIYNMSGFVNNYADQLKKIVLTYNYRSTQPILDVSKSLIERNNERLVKTLPGLSKDLISANKKYENITQYPVIEKYRTAHEEMIGVVAEVRKLVNHGVAPGQIGIIYREHKYGDNLARYFRQIQIPVFSKREVNLLTLPLIKKIILILRYLDAEHDIPFSGDEMLFEIMHFQNFGIRPVEIARLSIEANNKSFAEKVKISIRELIAEKTNAPAKDLFSISIDPEIAKASNIIEGLISDVANQTLLQLLESVIQKTGILSDIMISPDKHQDLKVLTALFHFVRAEAQRNPRMRLPDFIKIVDLMEKENLDIKLNQVSGSESAVNLLTAHGSKGLEFEYVFLVGSNANVWEKKKVSNKGYKLPDTLFSTIGNSDEEELRRLFYVAITRAEQFLKISFCNFNADGKEIEPSMFIAEIRNLHNLPIREINIKDEDLDEFSALMLSAETAPEIAQMEKDFVDGLLSKFVMNSTALNNYLKCPLGFYFNNLVRIPSAKNEYLEFGSSVHYALEQLFRKMLANEKDPGTKTSGKPAFPELQEFVADFEWFMKKHRESFTKDQFNRRIEYGNEVLSNYYKKYIGSFHTIVSIEQNIKNIVVNGVPIKGKLDKMEFYGNKVKVVDYKTGDPDKAKEKLKGPYEKQPAGGDYWRQAVFYKLLVDNFPTKDWKVEFAEFDFIEPNKKKEYIKQVVQIGPADIETVKQQITETWDKIQAHDFYTGCGNNDCHWCNFVKDNNLEVALHQIEEE